MNKSLLGSKGKEKRGVCEKLPSKSLCHFDSYPSTTKWNHRKEISGICDRYGGKESRAWWPCGPRRGSAVIRLPGLRVRILSGTWMAVCCQCCVLSGKVLCFGPITSPEKSYRVWCVWVWPWILDNEDALVHYGVCCVMVKKKKICQPNDDPAGPKHVAVWILCKKTVFRCLFVYLFLNMFWF